MSEVPNGEIPEKQTPAVPPTEQKNDPSGQPSAEKPKDGEEPMIPKSRLDQEAAKRRDAENKAEAALAASKAMQDKFDAMAAALAGGDISKKEANAQVEGISNKWGVPKDFVQELLATAQKNAEESVAKRFEKDLKPLQASQADTLYEKEFDALVEQYPDAEELSAEERKALKDLAFKPGFEKVPLTTLYKDMVFDKPSRGKSRTVESGRGGASKAAAQKPIGEMSLEEFEQYSNGLAKRG